MNLLYMEVIKRNGEDVYRYDDDINTVGIGIVVRAIHKRYPYVIGFRIERVDSLIIIDLEVDKKMLGGGNYGINNYYNLDIYFPSVDRDEVEHIRSMAKDLYDHLPDDFVNFYYINYHWNRDKEYVNRMGLNIGSFYSK